MKYLSMYKVLLNKEVFRSKEVYDLVSNRQSALNTIQLLLKKKFIKRIKRGLYYTVPLELIDKDFSPNVFLVASKIFSKSFLCYYTALELHGFGQINVSVSYIAVPFNSAAFTFKNHKYIFVKNKGSFGLNKKKIRDTLVFYTDLERTFLDCLRNLKYCISLEVFLKSFENVKLDFENLEKYLKKFNNNALYQKTGFILSLLKEDLEVPDILLQKIEKKVSSKTYHLETKTKGFNKKDKKWNLMIPKNIEELIRVA